MYLVLSRCLLAAFVYTWLSLQEHKNENAGLCTSGAIFAYCAFLTFAGLSSGNPKSCTRNGELQGKGILAI